MSTPTPIWSEARVRRGTDVVLYHTVPLDILDDGVRDLIVHATTGMSGVMMFVPQPNGTRLFVDPGDVVIKFPDGFMGRLDAEMFQRLLEPMPTTHPSTVTSHVQAHGSG